jgi:hypothetical protein
MTWPTADDSFWSIGGAEVTVTDSCTPPGFKAISMLKRSWILTRTFCWVVVSNPGADALTM